MQHGARMAGPSNVNFTDLWNEVQFLSPVNMDTFGAAYQTAQLLAATIKLVREAIARQRDQAEVLLRVKSELEETKCIVELVQNHEALQASGPLLASLKRIQVLIPLLQDHIASMSIDRGTFKAFTHQVIQGATERQDLVAIVGRLDKAKQDLGLHVQLVHVGLTMDANRAIGVNMRLVEEMNGVVRRVLGEERGLMIASFVKEKVKGGKSLEGDGRMQLTTSEYQALLLMNHLGNAHADAKRPDDSKPATPQRKERYINDNFSVTSTQVNVPIEHDIWGHMDYVNVQGNVATGDSLQVNYPMTLEVFREIRGDGRQKSDRKSRRK